VEKGFVGNGFQPQPNLLVSVWMTEHRVFVLCQKFVDDILRDYHETFINPSYS